MTTKTSASLIATAVFVAVFAIAAADEPFRVGVGGFSKAVCNEKGVKELKEIGADFVRCVGISDRATLDLLEKYGVKTVAKGVVPGWWGGKTEWAGLMHEKRPLSVYAKAKEKYVPHPAVLAVDIGDEPSRSDFAHYAKVVEYLNGELPGVAFTLNLFPSYGSHIARTPEERLKQLGTDSYEDYIRTFCEMFPTMHEVCFDFYPYSAPPAEVEEYLLRRLADFSIVSRACREYNRRLAFCLQANSLFKELEMDLPRLRYQAFTALAFGTRTLIWECYTPSWWENNILEKDGSKTPRYDRVRTVNAELHALTGDFARFRHIGTRLEGFSGDERKTLGDALDVRWRDFTAVRKMSCDGKIVIGEFKAEDGSGDTAVLVAAAWDPEGKAPGVKQLRFRANGSVRVYGQNGEVAPVRERDGRYRLDLTSDGAFFIVGGVPPPLAFLPANPDDQQRRFNPASDETLPLFVDMGFNAFAVSGVTRCDFTDDDPRWNESLAGLARQRMKRLSEFGAAALFSCPYGRDKKLSTRYPRFDRKGEKVPGRASIYELDAAEPAAQAAAARAIRKIAKELGREEGFAGLRPCCEIRLRTTPSFTARNAAAYRADTGREVPDEVQGRAAPHWSALKDIPANRIVSEHHPVLAFYRWFWQKGDGWNAFGDNLVEAFMDETGGRRVLTEYEPCLRTPPLFGCGGDMEMVGQWFYSYNDAPVNVGFDMAHIAEVARGTPGQITLVGLQCICHLSRIANPNNMKKGAPLPEWYALRKDLMEKSAVKSTYYPAMPPDLLRIGLWTAVSRQTDGLSFHGWQCVFDPAVYVDKFSKGKKGKVDARIAGYQYTNPELKDALADFMKDVAVPYGPLFKAVPERSPEVALFAGWASAILSGTAYMDWDRPHLCGVAAVSASLSPSVLFEEDVEMNGVPKAVKVLLMPEADVLTEGAYVRIREFQRKGGKIVAFKSLAPALKPDAELPAFCAPPPKRNLGAAEFETGFRAAVEEMKGTVLKYADPHVTTDSPFLCAHARGEEAYDLLFVVNDRRGPGEYAGVFNTVLDKGLPIEGSVTLKRNATAVYDLLAHRRIDCPAKDGAIAIPLSLGGAEGRIFLACDRELGALTATAKRVDGGSNGQDVRCPSRVECTGKTGVSPVCGKGGVEVTVASPDRDVMVPIRVDGVGRKPFYGVVKNGTWRHVFAASADLSAVASAKADVSVTNLADGFSAKADVR